MLTPPCSIQQHIIINANAITSQVNSIVSSIPINHAINSQPIIVSQFNTKNQAIRAIYHEQAFRENSPKNLIVQTVPRHDSANINVISKESLQETHLIRVNSTSTPVITPTVTEWKKRKKRKLAQHRPWKDQKRNLWIHWTLNLSGNEIALNYYYTLKWKVSFNCSLCSLFALTVAHWIFFSIIKLKNEYL